MERKLDGGFSTIEAALLLAVLLPVVTGLVSWLEVVRTQNGLRFGAYKVFKQLEVESRRGEMATLEQVLSRLENAVFRLGTSRFVEVSLYVGTASYTVEPFGGAKIQEIRLLSCSRDVCLQHQARLNYLSMRLRRHVESKVKGQVFRSFDPANGEFSNFGFEGSVVGMSVSGRLKGPFGSSEPIPFDYSSVVEVKQGG